jgi:hypothetical protein
VKYCITKDRIVAADYFGEKIGTKIFDLGIEVCLVIGKAGLILL